MQSGGDAASASAPLAWRVGTHESLEGLLPYYTQLAQDVRATPLVLERALWTHNVVLMAVQHALKYDKVQ